MTSMTQRIFVLMLLMASAASSFAHTEEDDTFIRDDYDGYYLTRMQVEMTVHKDHTYDVVEQFDAFFTEQRHGLYRSIPRRFWHNRDVSEAQDSSEYRNLYNAVEVRDIDVSEEFDLEYPSEVIDVRIGSFDRYVEGPHSYRVSYTLAVSDDRVAASDVFFHSVLGLEWTGSTDSLFFTIHFDEALPQSSLDAMKVYVGFEGLEATRTEEVIDYCDSLLLRGHASHLQAHNAVTLDIPLPADYFDKGPTPIWLYLSWIAAAATLLTLLWLIWQEFRGDDPVTSMVTFSPSEELSPADVGSLVDGKVDDKDLLSLIPWFAYKGHLSISYDEKNKARLKKLTDLPSDAPQYQKTLFDALFTKHVFLVEKDTKPDTFGQKWNEAKKQLKKQYEGKLDEYVPGAMKMVLTETFLFSLLFCWAWYPQDGWIMGGTMHVFLLIAVLFSKSAADSFLETFTFQTIADGCSSILGIGVLLFSVLVLFLVLCALMFNESDYYIPEGVIVALWLGTLLMLTLFWRMKRKTAYRRNYMGEILGLKEFIQTAEEDRLKMLLEGDERYFYRILPYAITFGMADKWADKFKNLTVNEAKEFSGIHATQVSHLLGSRSFASPFYKSAYQATSASRASGSGGGYHSSGGHRGGYSGGGSGGGGGRSW